MKKWQISKAKIVDWYLDFSKEVLHHVKKRYLFFQNLFFFFFF